MSRFTNPEIPFFLVNGEPNALGTVYYGEPNTDAKTNPKVPYLDAGFTTPASATQALTAGGKLQQELFLKGAYSLMSDDSSGSLIEETLNLVPSNQDGASSYVFSTVSDMVTGTTTNGTVITHALGQSYKILGRLSVNDGGGGDFVVTNDTANSYNLIDLGGGLTASAIFNKTPKIMQFGAYGDWDGATGTDDTAAAQQAIDYCIANLLDLEVNAMCLVGSLKIDRVVDGNSSSVTVPGDAVVDGAGNDNYFTILSTSGGGFASNTAVTMFDTNLTNNDPLLPCVQLTKFLGLKFEALSSATAAYVMSPKYLRTVFEGCSFRKIKCTTSPTQLMQSVYFINCQMRRWSGTWFSSKNANFDLRVNSCLMEAGGDAFDIDFPVGSSFQGATIEGMQNFAIKYVGGFAFSVINNYFEGNGRGVSGGLSIDGSAATGADASENIIISGCYFSGDDTDFTKPQVKWGDSVIATSMNNLCSTVLHEFTANSRVSVVNDYARMAIATNDQKTITGITQANPAVVTISSHGYFDGDVVSIVGVTGMTEVNDLQFTIANATTNTFELSGIDSTAYTAYASGGSAYSQNHGVRNEAYIGATYHSASNRNYGGRVYSEFVGGQGGFLRLRSVSDGVESPEGIDIDQNGDVEINKALRLASGTTDNYIEMEEMTDPTAPPSDQARIYTKDNGAGKTQLAVRFPTGAVQIIATEP